MTQRLIVLLAAAASVAIAVGLFLWTKRPTKVVTPTELSSSETWRGVLCYPDLQNDRFIRVPIMLTGLTLERAVTELVQRLQAPEESGADPALPPDARLRQVRRDGDMLVLDFDDKLTTPSFWAGSEVAHLRLQALVHTLTSLPGIRRVRVTVNGRTPDLGGHEDLSEPLEPDPTLN
ncbi:hypothetical protein HRbin17_00274 [bacterium HR17]|uniref:GerMN domain-containing protein n=1 Tax=Candidatus Fervidibacter japonicus TaxID=2035412 RepID=A0A2H5X9B6_9BACT|nr:hypothetical protein HRbin17_00274 [bacterium HR17]